MATFLLSRVLEECTTFLGSLTGIRHFELVAPINCSLGNLFLFLGSGSKRVQQEGPPRRYIKNVGPSRRPIYLTL